MLVFKGCITNPLISDMLTVNYLNLDVGSMLRIIQEGHSLSGQMFPRTGFLWY